MDVVLAAAAEDAASRAASASGEEAIDAVIDTASAEAAATAENGSNLFGEDNNNNENASSNNNSDTPARNNFNSNAHHSLTLQQLLLQHQQQQQQRRLIQLHLNTPQRTRGINIPLPPGLSMPQRFFIQQQYNHNGALTQQQQGNSRGGSGQGAAIVTNQQSSPPQQIFRAASAHIMSPYQPLEAKPLPNQINYNDDEYIAVRLNNQNNNSQKQPLDLKQFECSICFEYMDIPVKCGGLTCSSRFCHTCLQRVLQEELGKNQRNNATAANNDNQNNNNNNEGASTTPALSAKCPHCRNNFNQSDIQVDFQLQFQINDSTNTITCPFRGCNTEVQLSRLKSHEETCPFIRMRCKYAEWGCLWTGRKLDIRTHYATECEYSTVGPGLAKFIERYRKTVEYDHRTLLDQHRNQIHGLNQIQHVQSRQIMMMKTKNASDIVDVMALSYHVCCFPGRFINRRDLWSSILQQPGCRGTVGNMLLSFPTMVLVVSFAVKGFSYLNLRQAYEYGTDDFWAIADTVLMAMMMLALGIIYLACFYIDMQSPWEWTLFSVKNNVILSHPVIRDVAATSVTMIYFIVIEHFEFIRGLVMWHFMVVVTIIQYSFVYTFMGKVTGSPCSHPRSWSVIVFGLRYGLLSSFCNFYVEESPFACFVSVAIGMCLLRNTCKLPDFLSPKSTECFLEQGSLAVWMPSAALWLGYIITQSSWRDELLDWLYGTLLVAYANLFVHLVSKVGLVAQVTYERAIREVGRAQATILLPHPTGCIVFGLSNLLLLYVALTL